MSSPRGSTPHARLSANGARDSAWPVCPASRPNPAAGARPAFPPSPVVQVKALACELPDRLGLPLSRLSLADIRQEVLEQAWVAEISGATIWRGSAKMPSVLGGIEPGFFRAIRCSW